MNVAPLAVAGTLLALVVGCGSSGADSARTEPPSGGADPTATTELTIRVQLGDGAGRRAHSLTCDPAGGDHPDARAACRQLDRLKDPFAPVPPRTACTEIYGGPQTAKVTGTFQGEPVDAEFSRTNGCEIARWDAHAALFPVPGGAGI